MITIDGDGIYSKSTVHFVDEKTGAVTSTSGMKLVKKFEVEKSDQEFKERALPNTGSDSTSTAGLGFSAIAVAMMIAKRRRESDEDNI